MHLQSLESLSMENLFSPSLLNHSDLATLQFQSFALNDFIIHKQLMSINSLHKPKHTLSGDIVF